MKAFSVGLFFFMKSGPVHTPGTPPGVPRPGRGAGVLYLAPCCGSKPVLAEARSGLAVAKIASLVPRDRP